MIHTVKPHTLFIGLGPVWVDNALSNTYFTQHRTRHDTLIYKIDTMKEAAVCAAAMEALIARALCGAGALMVGATAVSATHLGGVENLYGICGYFHAPHSIRDVIGGYVECGILLDTCVFATHRESAGGLDPCGATGGARWAQTPLDLILSPLLNAGAMIYMVASGATHELGGVAVRVLLIAHTDATRDLFLLVDLHLRWHGGALPYQTIHLVPFQIGHTITAKPPKHRLSMTTHLRVPLRVGDLVLTIHAVHRDLILRA